MILRYTLIANASLCSIIFILHGLRYLLGWRFEFGPLPFPGWLSVLVVIAAGILLALNLIGLIRLKDNSNR